MSEDSSFPKVRYFDRDGIPIFRKNAATESLADTLAKRAEELGITGKCCRIVVERGDESGLLETATFDVNVKAPKEDDK